MQGVTYSAKRKRVVGEICILLCIFVSFINFFLHPSMLVFCSAVLVLSLQLVSVLFARLFLSPERGDLGRRRFLHQFPAASVLG